MKTLMNPVINMVINEKTKISVLIKANPLVIETLVAFNPHFSKLRNPILRSLLAGRVSIADACKIGDCEMNEFLDKMVEIGFEVNRSVSSKITTEQEEKQTSIPDNLKVIELDVR